MSDHHDHDDIGRRMRDALGDGSPEPGLRSRLIASLPDDPRPNRFAEWAMGGTALVLTLALIGGLLYVGGVFRPRNPTHPAGQFRGNVTLVGVGDLRCRLPIEGGSGGAFISFPDGGLSTDPTALTPGKGSYYGYGPYGGGAPGSTYDAAAGKWLPVQAASISPDQKSYAYIATTTGVPGSPPAATLHVVDASGAHDRTLWQGSGGGQILGWTLSAIYFTFSNAPTGGPPDAVLNGLDLTSGAVRKIATMSSTSPYGGPPSGQFTLIANGAAWGMGFPPPPTGPPAPGTASKSYGPNRVLRLDLKDGTTATWFTAQENESVTVAGLDSGGNPIIAVMAFPAPPPSGTPPQPYKPAFLPPLHSILTGPNQTTPLGDVSDVMFKPVSFFSDSHGTWIGTPNGSIYLLSRSGLRKVAVVPAGLLPSPTPPDYGGKGIQSPPPGFTPPTPPPGYTGVPVRVAGPCS